MKFRQLRVQISRADVSHAETLLSLAEPLALSFNDAADVPLFEPAPGTTPMWPDLIIQALFPADFDVEALGCVLTDRLSTISALECQDIDEADWRAGLEQDVYELRVAENLCVIPANFDTSPPARNPVRLHMGLAFGTGRHPTTALCLEWLAEHPPQGLSVCDYGCGSGVLAIAALKLDATEAIAIDNDPQALIATRANADLNDLAANLKTGTPEDFAALRVDVVLANILASTLCESADLFAAMLRPGGRIVLSGILEHQSEDVEKAFATHFNALETTIRDGWARISAVTG